MTLISAVRTLRDCVQPYVEKTGISGITYILNPLDYAWEIHTQYLNRFAPTGHTVEAILLGMNPGPWGMAQTGVPFGTPDLMRDFLKLTGEVHPPTRTHPKRPILGLNCPKNEVSGQRFWGAIRNGFHKPALFFKRFFVANYCPLAFQSESGGNLTPDKFQKAFWKPIESLCDAHLRAVIETLKPKTVIGVGKWATGRAQHVIETYHLDATVATILHPSPASPAANRSWTQIARQQLADMGHPWP